MTLEEIKHAIAHGQRVFWKHEGYEVKKNSFGEYNIVFLPTGNCIGLTWTDGVTMNGEPEEFYLG